MEADDILWQTKLAARLHDPAEKALVLLRDPAGHENGTSRALRRLLGLEAGDAAQIPGDDPAALANAAFPAGVPASIYRHVQRADWWAAAADRPQWPMEEISVQTRGGERTLRVARWAQVRWTNKPVLIHPLSGEQNDLGGSGGLADTDFHDIRARSLAHHERLLKAVGFPEPASADWRKALLALWRFAPELAEEQDNGKLGELWKLLPADTRVPDHSIWDHLDLTSAFAGAFAADPANEAALLTLSIGPVQPFIAAARKVEDLWAGSHLLARLSWEGMRVICDALGPDAILLPRLRSVPQVDLWLRDDCGLPEELFEHCDWQRSATDSNPLFGAALPNRFLAVVPASGAAELAAKIEHAVRGWLERLGEDTVARLLKAAEIEDDPALPCHAQMRDQLAGFPEVHWSVVPFSLVGVGNARKQTDLDTSALRKAMAPFFGTADEEPAGFLASSAWKVLHEKLELVDAEPADGEKGGTTSTFFEPNPGVLYPAIYELAERNLAAAKSLRPFEQLPQEGWRCTLSDETEWLTTDREELLLPPGQRTGTLWARIADRRPAWARKGEHLGALAAIKRLWPTIFASEVADALARDGVSRFVVSTHSMAIAHQLDQWLEHGAHGAPGLADLLEEHKHELGAAALPRRLVVRHAKAGRNALREAGMLPALLDLADESALSGAAGKPAISEQQAADIRRTVRETLSKGTAGETRLETYYGLLLMDGDRMGSWLANGHPGGGRQPGRQLR